MPTHRERNVGESTPPAGQRFARAGMLALVAALALLGAEPAVAAAAGTPGAAAERAAPDPGSSGRFHFLMHTANQDAHAYLGRRTAWILLGGAALSGICVAVEDADATARRLSGRGWQRVADVGNGYGEPVALGLGSLVLLGAGQVSGSDNLREAGFDAGRALAYSYIMVAGLKVAVDRTRPDGGRYSFPSAHAAGAFAVAPVLSRHFGLRAAVPAYTMALVTMVGRLQGRKHYLSDVVFGAAIGTSFGLAVESEHAPRRVGLSVSPTRIEVVSGF